VPLFLIGSEKILTKKWKYVNIKTVFIEKGKSENDCI